MKKSLFLLLVLVFAGCAPAPSLWGVPPLPAAKTRASTATATVTPTSTPTFNPTFRPTRTPTVTRTPTATLTPEPTQSADAIERVMIISFDGLRGDAVAAAPMPNLLGLMENGAYTLHAHSINYPVTLPSHASMLSGLCLDQHGVDWNGLLYYRGYSQGVDIFDLADAADMRSVMIVGKTKLRQVAEPETTDVFEVYGAEVAIGEAVIAQIPPGFDLMFVHFPTADTIGHRNGWMSRQQLKVLHDSDLVLGQILAALETYGLRDTTLVIVTADHGGHERTHDGLLQVDYDVPWVLSGPGVLPIELTTQVELMDTAATVAYALELPIPEEMVGIPVFEAFGLPFSERTEEACP
ncbi:MAG: alkaline phosphatase family protein [Chloroflexota bacterium]